MKGSELIMKNKKRKGIIIGLALSVLAVAGLASCTDGNLTTVESTTSIPTTSIPTTSVPSTSVPSTTNQDAVVSFDTDGGSQVSSQTIENGDKVTKPEDPTKDGYIFAGWFDSKDVNATAWDFAANKVSTSITLYAKWEKIYTVNEILELCPTTPGETSPVRYYVKATIDAISNPTYGGMTIKDETGEISVYGSYGADGEKRYSELDEKPYAGDEVLLYALLQNFNGTKEIKSGWIISFKHNEPTIDPSDYEEVSIATARAKEAGAKVKLTGVVARITYATGKKPSGFYLVDSTNSIYVYDDQIAAQVEIGNQITIAASKTYWILETEAANAEKYGYKGCCQVEKATLLENDKQNHEFDKSWISESTVKEMLANPVSNDITTTIYKVNALVAKKPGDGFVNYYFYDIDGKTGTYTYTQCNGSDFEWLDEFDNKICTVYLSIINAKSSASGCVYRILPIAVSDDNYHFNLNDSAKFAVEYYGVDQFKTSYSADPELELITSVSSDLLGITNATLSYTSNNENIIKFEVVDGKLVMHALNPGEAKITITGSYSISTTAEPITYSKDVTITVVQNQEYDSINVKAAIDSELEKEIIVKGIVGPSLVNQVGFYLIDSTGTIAVKTDSDTMSNINFGDEVIVKGTRTVFKSGTNWFGQSCLLDSVVLANNYGNHEYSKESFDSSKTIEELYDLDAKLDYSCQVFVVTGQISCVSSSYSTNYYVGTGEKKISLYSASRAQYAWLSDYIGQNLTIEIAMCNWNGKTYYRGCILSVTTESGETVYNQLNFKK